MRTSFRFALPVLVAFGLAGCTGGSELPGGPNSPTSMAAGGEQASPAAKQTEEGQTADQPLAITWDDLKLLMESGAVFESWMLPTRAKAVVDRYVRISGYIHGGISEQSGLREFPLMRDKDCPFGSGGHANHVILVNLQGKLRTDYTTAPVTVEGLLSVSPFNGTDGTTWAVYHLEGTNIR